MTKQAVETYPTYDGLGDIIIETRAWYRALGLQIGGSLYSVIRASEGITGLVHAIAKSIKADNISKKVHVVVEDTPSIAHVTYDGQTIVHVGSWLYNREKMERWHPPVKKMSESDMLVFTLGLINGAVALDMIASSTEYLRKSTIDNALRNINYGYGRRNDAVYAIERNRASISDSELDKKFIYISSAIHDILAIKTCLTEYGNASWIVFPLLLFREFFDGDFAYYAKTLIEEDDTLDNLIACVSALRCFSIHSASILDVKTSIGINLIRAMLAGTYFDIVNIAETAKSVISNEMLGAYIKEIRRLQEKQQKEGDGEGDSSDKSEKKQKGAGKSKAGNSDDSGDGDENSTENQEPQQGKNGLVDNIDAADASTPVNESISAKPIKDPDSFKELDADGKETRKKDHGKCSMQHRLSDNKKIRDGKSELNKSWLEDFMRLAFNGKIKFKNETPGGVPAPRTFDSISEYLQAVTGHGEDYYGDSNEYFRENILAVYNSVDKTSLKNLFLERTMDVEKSQPARSGIALIPTRIVNMFTDEKIFSPLPENETERDSEVIILVDASGSMRGGSLAVVDNSGKRHDMSLYAGVTGAAYAIADGLQRANVNCSVFAHSTMHGGDGVFVCKITDQYSCNRLNEFASAGSIVSRNNGDSYALEEVSKFFSQDGHDVGRTLIVLSDGQPAFHGYSGDENGHMATKKAADKLRDEGIKVYSISLVDRVVRDNDRIYGKANNFFPVDEKDGNTVSLSPMLKKIVDIVAENTPRSANNVLTQG